MDQGSNPCSSTKRRLAKSFFFYLLIVSGMQPVKIYLTLCFLFSLKLFGQAPVIDSISPTRAYAGDVVRIYGKNLSPVTKVSFGGADGYSVQQVSDSEVKATVNCCPSGDLVTLNTTNGAGTLNGFRFLEPPVLTVGGFSPINGLAGDTIIIYGSYFKHVTITDVKFGSVPAASFIVNSDGQITAVVGSGETGLITVIVNGRVEMSYDSFYYASSPPPVISYFTPSSAEVGELISISGNYFTEPATVTIGGVNADSIKLISSNQITARVPAIAASGAVTVSTPAGVHSLNGFRIIVPVILCPPVSSVILTAETTGTAYQWEVNKGLGFGWENLSNNANYTGVTSNSLQINNIPSSWYGYRYTCFITGKGYFAINRIKFKNNWMGTENNLWENIANWSCNQLPDTNTDVIINTGNVVINSNVTVRTLTVKPGASVTVTPGFNLTVIK